MIFSIITLFPEFFSNLVDFSILKRASNNHILEFNFIDLRDFGIDKRRSVDDHPYGGGAGMILRIDVLDNAIKSAKKNIPGEKVILLDPKGKTFNQSKVKQYSKLNHLILVCGHYEGVDARIYSLVDEVISTGNFILTGGELPAAIIIDSVGRLIPNVIKRDSIEDETFSKNLSTFEYPQFTRPKIYKGKEVPATLLSGNHKKIQSWRDRRRKIKTV